MAHQDSRVALLQKYMPYAERYTRHGTYPRKGIIKWARDQLANGASFVISILTSLIGNIIHLISTGQVKLSITDIGGTLNTLVHIILPATFFEPLLLFPTLLIIAIAIILFIAAQNDKRQEEASKQDDDDTSAKLARRRELTQQRNEQQREVREQLFSRLRHYNIDTALLPETPLEETPTGTLNEVPMLMTASTSLIGREKELNWLSQRLRPKIFRNVVALVGPAGCGKTTLARAALKQGKNEFYDGIAVIDCLNLTNPLDILSAILARFAPRRMGLQHYDDVALTNVAVEIMKGYRVLVVLENVGAQLQQLEYVIEPLQQAGTAILVLTRDTLNERLFPVDTFLNLEGLQSDDARALFSERAGLTLTHPADFQAADAICTLLKGNPLAITLMAAFAAAKRPALPQLARDVQNQRAAGDDSGASTPVDLAMTRCYDCLSAPAQHLLTTFGVLPTAACSSSIAEALAQRNAKGNDKAEALLKELRALGMLQTRLQQDSEGIFLVPPIVHAAAQQRLKARRAWDLILLRRWLARLYIVQAQKIFAVPHHPDRTNYFRLLAWTENNREDRLLIQLCYAARRVWRNTYQYYLSLYYLPRALVVLDQQRRSVRPWIWLRYHAREWLTAYYGILFYYANALDDTWSSNMGIDLSQIVFQRSLRVARRQRNTLAQAEVQGSLAASLFSRGSLIGEKMSLIQRDFEQAREVFQRILSQRGNTEDRAQVARDLGNALAGLGFIAQMQNADDKAQAYFDQGWTVLRDGDDYHMQAAIRERLADLAQKRGDYRVARGHYQAAARLRHFASETTAERDAIQNSVQMVIWMTAVDSQEALLKEELGIWQAAHSQYGEGLVQLQLGLLHWNNGEFEVAIAYIEKARLCFVADHVRDDEGNALLNLGNLFNSRNYPQEANRYYQEALQKSLETANRRGTANAFMTLGNLALQNGEITEAEATFLQARAIFAALSERDRFSEGTLLGFLGSIAQQRGQIDLARSYFEEALTIKQSYADQDGQAQAWSNLGNLEQVLYHFDQARDCFARARKCWHAAGNYFSANLLRSNDAQIMMLCGQVDEARPLLEELVKACNELDYPTGVGASLVDLSTLALEQGDYAEAERRLKEIHDIFHRGQFLMAEGVVATTQGLIDEAQGRFAEAEHNFANANDFFRKIEDRTREGQILVIRGWLAYLRGQSAEARRLLKDGLRITRETQDKRHQGISLIFLGEIALAAGNRDEARDNLGQGITLAGQAEDRRYQGYGLSLMAQLLLQAGALADADATCKEAIRHLDAIHDRPNLAVALSRLAQITATRGDLVGARTLFDQARALVNKELTPLEQVAVLLAYGTFLADTAHDPVAGLELVRQAVTISSTIKDYYLTSVVKQTLVRLDT